MKVFISWSGPGLSLETATFLRKWLPRVLQFVKPWMSERDIPKGAQGLESIHQALKETPLGIFCMTAANQGAPWLNFEAGRLAAREGARLWTLLLDLQPADVTGPLAQYQHTRVGVKDDVLQLLRDINALALEAERVEADVLENAFDKNWPDFQSEFARLAQSSETSAAPKKRDLEDKIDEILELARAQARATARGGSGPTAETEEALLRWAGAEDAAARRWMCSKDLARRVLWTRPVDSDSLEGLLAKYRAQGMKAKSRS